MTKNVDDILKSEKGENKKLDRFWNPYIIFKLPIH